MRLLQNTNILPKRQGGVADAWPTAKAEPDCAGQCQPVDEPGVPAAYPNIRRSADPSRLCWAWIVWTIRSGIAQCVVCSSSRPSPLLSALPRVAAARSACVWVGTLGLLLSVQELALHSWPLGCLRLCNR